MVNLGASSCKGKENVELVESQLCSCVRVWYPALEDPEARRNSSRWSRAIPGFA